MLARQFTTDGWCPECGHEVVKRVRWRVRRKLGFTVIAPRVCENCRIMFIPAAPRLLRLLAFIVGIGVAVVALFELLLPSIEMLIEGIRTGKAMSDIVAGTATMLFAAYMLLESYRTGRPRIIDDDVELS